jgi:acylphosphatase
MPCARFVVSGRVQGVFYRASAREQAVSLGLAGHAKNLLDGDVEVVACGTAHALDAMERWLRLGPPAARVEAVSREELPERELHGFVVG